MNTEAKLYILFVGCLVSGNAYFAADSMVSGALWLVVALFYGALSIRAGLAKSDRRKGFWARVWDR